MGNIEKSLETGGGTMWKIHNHSKTIFLKNKCQFKWRNQNTHTQSLSEDTTNRHCQDEHESQPCTKAQNSGRGRYLYQYFQTVQVWDSPS